MKFNKYLLLIFATSLAFINVAYSQEYSAKTSVVKDTILIGEQTEITIEAKGPKGGSAIFPLFKDSIPQNITVILEYKPVISDIDNFRIFQKKYLVTSFDTGVNVINSIPVQWVQNSDTNEIVTESISVFVKPYVLLDTIPVDTTYAGRAGFVAFGKNGFHDEIEKYIPDSVKQSLPADSLNILKKYLKKELLNLYSSEITKATGLYDQDLIIKIAESSSQKLYLVDKSGILEEYNVTGSVDTIFVKEFQQVVQNQPLFTLFRIKDIREDIYNTPFNLAEFWYYFKLYFKKYWWILILALSAIATAIYFIFFFKKQRNPIFFKIKPKLPAHIIALTKLENIRKEKIWSRGQIKEFHIQLTDVLREYLENRFGIYAVEMTTSEILEAFSKQDHLNNEDFNKLQQILVLADSVKFAKYQSLQNENDLSIKDAFEFVNNTKEIIVEDKSTKQVEAKIEINEEPTLNETESNG